MDTCKNSFRKKQNSIWIEDYVNNEIFDDDFNPGNQMEMLNQYFALSEKFHQPKGEGFKLVLNCLQKYLDFKFIRENNHFRFQEALFDYRGESLSSVVHDNYGEMMPPASEFQTLEGTKADIYYLLYEADQESVASRRCWNYVNSNRLHLTAILVQMIERIVSNLESNSLNKYREYGRVLRAAYMTPEYADLDVFALFEVLGYSKKKYYRLRNDAISLISETLFGVLAGEHGLSNLYVAEDEIRISY